MYACFAFTGSSCARFTRYEPCGRICLVIRVSPVYSEDGWWVIVLASVIAMIGALLAEHIPVIVLQGRIVPFPLGLEKEGEGVSAGSPIMALDLCLRFLVIDGGKGVFTQRAHYS